MTTFYIMVAHSVRKSKEIMKPYEIQLVFKNNKLRIGIKRTFSVTFSLSDTLGIIILPMVTWLIFGHRKKH